MVHAGDVAHQTRWPRFTAQARDLGIRGVLTCELPMTRGVAATPNLCSTQPATFTTIGELIALVFAVHASTALAHADDVEHLYRAIESRRTVGLALGILVERHRLTPPDQAFEPARQGLEGQPRQTA